MALPYDGMTALVTGASAGIGRSIAESLLEGGARVLSVAREPLEIEHARLTSYSADLANPAETRDLAARIAASEPVDILVNNAGVVRNTPLEAIGDAEFDEIVNLHMRAAILFSQAFAPGMKARGFGRIVNMSTRAVVGLANRTVYAGSKAALIAMTRTWALELGPFGVTVNAIAPGPVVTGMLTADIPEHSEKALKLAASIPRRRLGRPDDIARAALFFTDPRNDWVTGQTLFVCGGASVGAALAL